MKMNRPMTRTDVILRNAAQVMQERQQEPPVVREISASDEDLSAVVKSSGVLVEYNLGLRCNAQTRQKIKDLMSALTDDVGVYTDSSDEYVPSEQGRKRMCGVPGCKEDIFIACHEDHCQSFM